MKTHAWQAYHTTDTVLHHTAYRQKLFVGVFDFNIHKPVT